MKLSQLSTCISTETQLHPLRGDKQLASAAVCCHFMSRCCLMQGYYYFIPPLSIQCPDLLQNRVAPSVSGCRLQDAVCDHAVGDQVSFR